MEKGSFGLWLKERRRLLDLTQDELALRVSCSPVLIRKIETNERRPSKQNATLLATHLNIPVDEHADFVRFARAPRACVAPGEKSPWRTWRQHLTNLPTPPAPLFGRTQEIEAIVRQMVHDHVRLLTLVGPPGVGKTRLAIACGEELLDYFDDGVYFIALAPVRDPDLVLATMARVLGLNDTAQESRVNGPSQYLADKRMLVLLDNFEQVVAAAPLVAELSTHCPWVQMLVTSRVSLHIRPEKQFRVAPLASPSAVQFFMDRARSVEPALAPTAQDTLACAEICRRLDGLPLAIELVATRASTFSLQELLAQTERWLALATRGPRDLPARHQTLRDAMAFSFELLDAAAQALFARLAIFVGGWTAEMARAICSPASTESDLMRALSTLDDASLVAKGEQSDPARWSMLETIREYAAERLAIGGQAEATAKRHADFFLAFAKSAAPHLSGPHQVEWLNRLDRDHGNLHAALEWAIERGEAELALRLGGALYLSWYKQGWLIEGRSWLKRALALPAAPTVAPTVRQSALHGASVLAWSHDDFAEAEHLAEESLALAREIGDRQAIARAINVLANVAVERSDYVRAIALHEQNLALRRDLGDKVAIASSLNNLGRIAYFRGDAAQAIVYYEESLALQRELRDHFGIALALNNLGGALADNLQELDRATMLLQESLTRSREPGTKYFLIHFTLTHLGRVALYAGDLERAQTTLEEGLGIAREWRSRTGMAFALLYLAQLALGQNDLSKAASFLREGLVLQRAFDEEGTGVRYLATSVALLGAQHDAVSAATLIGAIAGLCESAGIRLPSAYLGQHDVIVSATRARLDEQTFRAAFARGYTMTMAQAFDFALENSARDILKASI